MSCDKCECKWCWTCGWEMSHWFHTYQGDHKIICDLVNDIYFGKGRLEFPDAVRGILMFLIMILGPFVAGIIASVLILIVYFLIFAILIKLTIRWNNEKKTLKEQPQLAEEYQSMVYTSQSSPLKKNKGDRYKM